MKDIFGQEMRTGPISEEAMRRLPLERKDQAFIILESFRPGAQTYIQELEYSHYVPDTERNDLFSLLIVKFPHDDMNMLWMIVQIPLTELEKATELAKKYEFRLAKKCLPMVIDEKGEHWFPMASEDNVFTVQGTLKDKKLLEQYGDEMHRVMEAHQAKVIRGVHA